MKKPYAILLISFLVVFVFAAFFFVLQKEKPAPVLKPTVKINNITIPIELADTPQKQIQGLSDRAELGAESGMLFVFPDKKARSFWMKNMHFPLDIIWINDDKIINISKNLAPKGEHPEKIYGSEGDANYALEVNGGFCDQNDIKIGDKVIPSFL